MPKLGDIPVGLRRRAIFLPVLMPTANYGLVRRTLGQSVGINRPPPGQLYHGRATTFSALYRSGTLTSSARGAT